LHSYAIYCTPFIILNGRICRRVQIKNPVINEDHRVGIGRITHGEEDGILKKGHTNISNGKQECKEKMNVD